MTLTELVTATLGTSNYDLYWRNPEVTVYYRSGGVKFRLDLVVVRYENQDVVYSVGDVVKFATETVDARASLVYFGTVSKIDTEQFQTV